MATITESDVITGVYIADPTVHRDESTSSTRNITGSTQPARKALSRWRKREFHRSKR